MKRTAILLLACMAVICAANPAVAEDSAIKQGIARSAAELETYFATLTNYAQTVEEDSDAQTMLSLAQNSILISESVLTTALNDAAALSETSVSESAGGTNICRVPQVLLDELGLYAECDTVFRKKYLLVRYSLYDESEEYLGTQCLEIGERDDVFIFLLVDYGNTMDTTGRFAMRIEGADADVIYTRTLGMTMKVKLDVSAWQAGEPLDTWDKKLLLPQS